MTQVTAGAALPRRALRAMAVRQDARIRVGVTQAVAGSLLALLALDALVASGVPRLSPVWAACLAGAGIAAAVAGRGAMTWGVAARWRRAARRHDEPVAVAVERCGTFGWLVLRGDGVRLAVRREGDFPLPAGPMLAQGRALGRIRPGSRFVLLVPGWPVIGVRAPRRQPPKVLLAAPRAAAAAPRTLPGRAPAA